MEEVFEYPEHHLSLNLATFSMCALQRKNYADLKFLCKIWGLSSMFEIYYKTRLENGRRYKGRKDEIVIRLRKKMRQRENQLRPYIGHTKISTPESIRPSY